MKTKMWQRAITILIMACLLPFTPAVAQSTYLWKAEYFSNRDLTGTPVLIREEEAIDFDWFSGSPDKKIPEDNFSVRWSRTLHFTAGNYRFFASCDDGVRIYVDGIKVVGAWKDQPLPNTQTGDIYLSSGSHKVVVEYYEHGGQASAHVWWDVLQTFNMWKGVYYDNTQLRGGPVLFRDDADINFDWSDASPVSHMPKDNFSVIWTRTVDFAPGDYRFNVRSDDGVRIWLDNALIMDYWQTQDNLQHYIEKIHLSGKHTIKVTYFERTGYARIRFWWEPFNLVQTTPIPIPSPVKLAPAPLTGPWSGEYFNNPHLTGNPILSRTDAVLDFDWKWDAPATGMNRDYFSVRWSGTFYFDNGKYRFTSTSDDGIRVYVDDMLVIDAWRPMRGTRTGFVTLTQGNHIVRVEYFERSQAAMAKVSAEWLSAPQVLPTPKPQLPICSGGPLRIEAWPIEKSCTSGGGWSAHIYIGGYGGNCRYTYSWDGQVKGVVDNGPITFVVKSANRGYAIVGTASVQSAGESAKIGVYVAHPSTCD